jgi:hypothetical protein
VRKCMPLGTLYAVCMPVSRHCTCASCCLLLVLRLWNDGRYFSTVEVQPHPWQAACLHEQMHTCAGPLILACDCARRFPSKMLAPVHVQTVHALPQTCCLPMHMRTSPRHSRRTSTTSTRLQRTCAEGLHLQAGPKHRMVTTLPVSLHSKQGRWQHSKKQACIVQIHLATIEQQLCHLLRHPQSCAGRLKMMSSSSTSDEDDQLNQSMHVCGAMPKQCLVQGLHGRQIGHIGRPSTDVAAIKEINVRSLVSVILCCSRQFADLCVLSNCQCLHVFRTQCAGGFTENAT